MKFEDFLSLDPYELEKTRKEKYLTEQLQELTEWHRDHCEPYSRILRTLKDDHVIATEPAEIPFVPVRLFKEYHLSSLSDEKKAITLTSSGTTGQQRSKIYIDEETSKRQKKVLAHIMSSFMGEKRLPLLILDSRSALRDRKDYGARGAGILGFSILGRDVTYALDQDMNSDIEAMEQFLEKHQEENVILFGFTFIIWQSFYLQLKKRGIKLPFHENAKLFHTGGWKKLTSMAVDENTFRKALQEDCGICNVHNYYGMAEQLGSVYVECECGHMHASNYSDIIIRKPLDFSVQAFGEKGIVELVSILPKSYPGHAILTEDEGVILGEDDCPCGRKGKYFKLTGRLKNAELRGCSDTYADKLTRH